MPKKGEGHILISECDRANLGNKEINSEKLKSYIDPKPCKRINLDENLRSLV